MKKAKSDLLMFIIGLAMLAGVFWWFITPKKIAPKILTGIGAALIVASVVMNTRFFKSIGNGTFDNERQKTTMYKNIDILQQGG